MDPAERRQHLLIIDEAHRFGTRAVENISVEGRKFGLALALASQSLAGMGERLSRTIVTDPRPRLCPTPVGSPAWIRLLGTGGAEETDEALT